MLWRTHLALGLVVATYYPLGIEWILVLVGSLLPDIDSVSSILGRHFKIIGRSFEHRSFFHSIFGLALFCGVGYSLFSSWSLGMGYATHLILDAFTIKGLQLYPFAVKIRGFVKVGGFIELLIFIGFVLLFLIRLL